MEFNVNSQDIIKELVQRKIPSKAIGNSFLILDEIKESKDIATMNVTNEVSEEKYENINNINQNPDNPVASVSNFTIKRKRGRPKKGTCTLKQTNKHRLALKHRKYSSSHFFSKKSIHLKVEVNDNENEIDGKPKRRRRSRKMKDYITEFGSSDEEDTKPYNTYIGYKPQSKSLSAKNISKQNLIKEKDNYNLDIDDSFMFENDLLNESSFELSESESETTQVSLIEDSKQILEIGPEKKTKLEIINTGEVEATEGSENMIYHLVTTTGNTSTISQLLIPNTLKNEVSDTTPGKEQTFTTTAQQSNKSSSLLSSTENRFKGKLQRSYKRKLSELKQKVNIHLRELRRQPQSSSILELLNGASKFLTEEQLVFLSMQLKTKHIQAQNMRFSVREKMLSLALYQQSPSVYKYLTTVFHLPNKLVLERWLEGLAKTDPLEAKRLMYHVYAKYIYRV